MQGHIEKIIVFGVAGFAWSECTTLLFLTDLAVITGTIVGSRTLDKVDERTFVLLYETTLTLSATRMVLEQIL